MHPTNTMVPFTLLILVSFVARGCHAAQEVILQQDVIMEPGTLLTAQNGTCQLKMQRDGNLVARRWDESDQKFRAAWAPGPLDRNYEYYAIVDSSTGTLQIRRSDPSNMIVYTTVRSADPYYNAAEPPYRLAMDEKCVLSVLGYEYDNDGTFDVEVWQSVRRSLTNTDVMQKGDILTGFHHLCSCSESKDYCVTVPMHIILQRDCNLVQRVGHDRADAEDIVWSPNVGRNVDECYVYVDQNFVGLFEGKFDPSTRHVGHPARTGLYWRTELGNWEETEVHDDMGFYAD